MNEKRISIALAGNANVGKSVLFNALTGMHQHIGNWPGKTVEKAEGTFFFAGYIIDVIDLPGIYSLSTYSIEEKISRDYIAIQKPDVVVNVIDASALERNLFFTLQLLELNVPMVVALNQMDVAERKGIKIDAKKLSKILGVPVIPMVATKGTGLAELVSAVIGVASGGRQRRLKPKYSKNTEALLRRIEGALRKSPTSYAKRWTAIKLLEGDESVIRQVGKDAARKAALCRAELHELCGKPPAVAISSERYAIVSRIAKKVVKETAYKPAIVDYLEEITTHKVAGYVVMAAALLAMFFAIFSFGDFASRELDALFEGSEAIVKATFGENTLSELIFSVVEGFAAGVTIALPYIVPFYIVLSIVEDSGYLSRIAFLMDSLMHKIGLHGKAIIPLILGYGCNVPACLSCRIMERDRERTISAFLTTLVPCAARTVIILGLVGTYVGLQWALALYIFNLLVIFVLGRILNATIPGEPVGLIIEMHTFRRPSLTIALKMAWFRVREFVYIAFPLIIATSVFIKAMEMVGALSVLSSLLTPVTVDWLGLPAVTAVTLVFGILRKELALVLLAALVGTTDFGAVLSPLQMIVLTLVLMFYIPCIATFAALVRELGWVKALAITVFEIVFAVLLGGIAMRVLAATVF
jgi:ferrous iron transport protein B